MSMVFCRGCGKEIHETAVSCPHCGAPQSKASSGSGKKQDTAFLLACFLGVLGGHRFYLGNIGLGILYLFTLGLLGIGTLIDLFNLVSMRPEVFAEKYNNGGVGQPIGTWTKGLLIFPVVIALIIYRPFFQSFYQGFSKGYTQREADVTTGKTYEDASVASATQRQADVATGKADKFSELAAATPAQISPTGELAAMFNLMSDNTDLQRENKLKEIKGKIVEWALPVYEIAKDGDGYKVQTEPGDTVGTFVYITPRNDEDKAIIEALKTGSWISIKGIIKDDFLRNLVIKPAILFLPGSVKPVAIEAQQPVPVAQASQAQAEAPAAEPQQSDAIEQSGICKGLNLSVTPDQIECAQRDFENFDKQLNNTYKQLMATLDPSRKAILKKEQIAWIKEKELKCDEQESEFEGGQLGRVLGMNCIVHMTEQRLAYLKNYK